jgi:hypothetical protein
MKSIGQSGPWLAERHPVKKGALISGLETATPANPSKTPTMSTQVEM